MGSSNWKEVRLVLGSVDLTFASIQLCWLPLISSFHSALNGVILKNLYILKG